MQGVVGAVDAQTGVIEVRATGSSVTRIEVAPGAVITRTGGGAMALTDIKSSDRIVATGEAGGSDDTLVASRITVQAVVRGGPPGAAPGG